MKLEIKLKDSKYCDECPCQCYDAVSEGCNLLDYNSSKDRIYRKCNDGEYHIIRPQICIKQNGK